MHKTPAENEPQPRDSGVPLRLRDYATEHPEILPSYRPFAHDIIDLVDRLAPREFIALTGPHGIGKSGLLAPSLFEAATARGYESNVLVGGVHTNHGYELQLDPHAWYGDKDNPSRLDLDELRKVAFAGWERPELDRFKQAISRRFSESNGQGICFFDEFYGFSSFYPELSRTIADIAQQNRVTLVTTTPLVDTFGAHETSRERITWETDLVMRRQAEVLDGTMIKVGICEQQVPLEGIRALLEVYDVAPEGISVFERSPVLRRLQVFDRLIVQLLGVLRNDHPEIGAITIQQLGHMLSADVDLDLAITAAGLTPEGYKKMILDMRC